MQRANVLGLAAAAFVVAACGDSPVGPDGGPDVSMSGPSPYVAGGRAHTCVIVADGALYCWGANEYGQLGDGTREDRLEPVRVEGGPYVAVTAGFAHTCAVSEARPSYCWGSAGNVGILGDGVLEPQRVSPVPVMVAGGHAFRSASAGSGHTCAVAADGGGWCWGYDLDGQLGRGPGLYSHVPVQVHGGIEFAAIGAGDEHSCGIAVAGAAYCWGLNHLWQLGDRTDERSAVPVAVAGGLSYAAIAVGNAHACALTAGGAAYCWGAGRSGQLGRGLRGDSNAPYPVSGGHSFVAIAAGRLHTCAIERSGIAFCWGANDAGQVGDDTSELRSRPVPVAGGGVRFHAIGAGRDHTCGVATNAGLYCWGAGGSGQLGGGAAVPSDIHVRVTGLPAMPVPRR